MGSDKRNGRDDRANRGAFDPRRRRAEIPNVEGLEERRLLTAYIPTSADIYDAQHGPIANIGAELINVYRSYTNYIKNGSTGKFVPALSGTILFQGTSVGVDVRGVGDFTSFQKSLTNLGMTITATSPSNHIAEGYIPIAQLPTLAVLSQVANAKPIYASISRAFQGAANNESVSTLNVPASLQASPTAGAGQGVGVLSDSVNKVGGGVQDSINTGDLPKSGVQIIQDLLNGAGTDEGRAMLEQIHDIAPGATLGFASATNGEVSFAQNIIALNSAGFKTIVDDIGIRDDPFYQDGVIAQAVNTVTAAGATYLSAAGNSADEGYESQFRGVSATVGSLGAGRYMNFDGSGASVTTQLGVYVPDEGANNRASISFQFDQPYGLATSDVTAYLLDSSGNIAYQGVSNPGATGDPFQTLVNAAGDSADILPGTYTLVIKVNSGADPGHIFAYNFSEADVAFDHKFGSAGDTYYPTTFGHAAAANTIGVAAVPYYGSAPYLNRAPTNEPFSSFGPVLSLFNPDGSTKAPQLLLKPDISSADGNNTSFFGQVVDTTTVAFPVTPVYPGNTTTTTADPTTATNQNQNLPSFYGTSSAAPNLAAVVALLKQSTPSLTSAQIRSALISTATPVNNAAKGVWNPQGGYGLANATAALAAVAVLQVASVSPGGGATVTASPTFITVTFSKPVNGSTLSASSIQVTAPNGATVTVGAPVAVDSPTYPSVVRFPISVSPAAGRVADGVYTVRIPAGTIRGQDGTVLATPFTDTFNLQDTVAPTVANTTFNGRIVTLTFSEAINPNRIDRNSVYLMRSGGQGTFGTSASVIVSNLPGATFSYNPATLTVTLDLTNVPQAQLPADQYALIASNYITDVVGNPLNGSFNGSFPSGSSPSTAAGSQFAQIFNVASVPAPVISTLVLAPSSDSGIVGDRDTNVSRPSFVGQVTAQFPNTNAGLTVYAEFNGIAHAGVATGRLDLGIGGNGRGTVGNYDVIATTDANGTFTINYPAGVTPLPEGQNILRVVVVGAADAPPAPGLAATLDTTFQIDRTLPFVANTYLGVAGATTLATQNISLNSLTNLLIAVFDPVNPVSTSSPFAVNTQSPVTALNPATAANIANYRLTQIVSPTQTIDRSSFLRNAQFSSTIPRTSTASAFAGQIALTFATGLPQGNYTLTLLSSGITDSAGNPLTDSFVDSSTGTATPYTFNFNLQPTPVYVTNYGAYTGDASLNPTSVISGPRANYEVPAAGTTPNAPAPPNVFYFDFSNQLASSTAAALARQVIIARSANSATGQSDGDFGNFGTATGLTNPSGYYPIPTANVTVSLVNSVAGATAGQVGYQNRLLISVPAGATSTPDYYRIWLPNTGTRTITDIFGNQLDGEFQGYQNAAGKYVDQLNTGVIRGSGAGDVPDLSGDGIAGGAFVTGFVVVPNGNIIYARPDAIYNPQLPASLPDGSAAKPYPVLAAQATFTTTNNGDLNSPVNSGVNFNPAYDRAGLGSFQPSAFFAAQEKARLTLAPVVIIAEPALSTRDPFTGVVSQRPFVLQAPGGSNPITNDGSAAVPAMTTLVFQAGATLKMQNAALLVQNQGSSLQVLGGPNANQIVNVTSYKDSSIGGVTNGDPTSTPASGDYGGILFRSYREAGTGANNLVNARATLFPGQLAVTGNSNVDQRLKGPFANTTSRNSQVDALSGADDVMSYVNFLVEKYAGGVVPINQGVAYDGIVLQNSRPTIINTTISYAGLGQSTLTGSAATNAGLSEDFDSLRSDDIAAGPLFRNITLTNNGINGIFLRGRAVSGVTEASNATNINANGSGIGSPLTYVMNAFLPYVLTTNLLVGSAILVESGGNIVATGDRLYVNPGTIIKLNSGSGVEVGASASFNVGDQTYLREFDANPNVAPGVAGFKANSALLAKVIFTSIYDDTATTTFSDPISGIRTTVTPALSSAPGGSGINQPTPTNIGSLPTSRWSGITIDTGAVAVINSAIIEYGGGARNTAFGVDNRTGSFNFHHALELSGGGFDSDEFYGNGSDGGFFFNRGGLGSHVSITNNTFQYNQDVGLNVDPQALLAADPLRPLQSGNPFIHGNLFTGNDLNGVGVAAGTGIPVPGFHSSNLDVNSTWTGSDFTYILRDTIVLGPNGLRQTATSDLSPGSGIPAVPSATAFGATPPAAVTLTLQSTLPGTVLADGTVVAAPGLPLVVKTLNNGNSPIPAETIGTSPGANTVSSWSGGAGFIVGVDDGTDPPTPTEVLVDNGAFSQIRILGISANSSTGQTRVPVTITSIYDNSVGTTVGTTTQNQVMTGATRTTGLAGDGGIIYFGGNSLTSYNLQDPRSGSIIDNADIKFMTRIEQQGGGIAYVYDRNADRNFDATNDDPFNTLYGNSPATQYNSPKRMTLSNSNFSTFSDGGIVTHPGYGIIGVLSNFSTTMVGQNSLARFGSVNGEPTQLYLVNNTFSNMIGNAAGRNVAIDIIGQPGNDSPNNGAVATAMQVVVLNNTFYRNGIAINSTAQTFNGMNPFAQATFLALDSIFASNTIAIQAAGQADSAEVEYSLLTGNGTDLVAPTAEFFITGFLNSNITGDPGFRNAAAGDFSLTANSAAIDRARSEVGPNTFGNLLTPSATLTRTSVDAAGNPVFYDTNFTPIRNTIGDSLIGGGDDAPASSADIVTLPGLSVTDRGFPDEWAPTLLVAPTGTPVSAVGASSTTLGTTGNGYNVSTYAYVPVTGQRDQLGNIRQKDPNSKNFGSGTNPFFDMGAFEYFPINTPKVTSVAALTAVGTASTLYLASGVVGTNQTPASIRVGFNEQLNTATLTASSVQLIGSGGDGIFGNANDIAYNLNNRLNYDTTTNTLVINTTGLLPTGPALNDLYELVLKGTGSSIIRDTSGNALDGFTSSNTLPLPSGSDNIPGSDFMVSFTIDTNPPTLVAGTFNLALGSYTTATATAGAANVGYAITRSNTPTFVGKITDIYPPNNPLAGSSVFVDISTTGDANNFDRLNAATGVTDANGNFSVTVAQALPDSNWNVGPDGKIGTKDDTGSTIARVRVVDQSGNTTLLTTSPLSAFAAAGAAFGFIVDTLDPQVTSVSPTAGTQVLPSNGQVAITATFNENINPASLNASSVLVYRAGGTGTFTGLGTPVTIVPGSFNISYLGGTKGPVRVTFNIQAPVNDFYRIVLKGTGTSPITDIAGNPLNGSGTGNAGSDFSSGSSFTVFSPTSSRLIYVGSRNYATDTTQTQGTREFPFTTIAAGIAAAQTGDTVLVLPGTYYENLVMKGQIRLLSADPSSTDTSFLPGNPLATIIDGNPNPNSPFFNSISGITTINAANIATVPGVQTEISGFTILNPLLGDSVTGQLDTSSTAINLVNSNVTVDKNYIVNAGIGVLVSTTSSNSTGPLIASNVIVGNYTGVQVTDQGVGVTYASPVSVINNTIADNTYGVINYSGKPSATQIYIINDIFYNNHALSTARTGYGILSYTTNTAIAVSNLFFNNGVNNQPASNVNAPLGVSLNPATLSFVPNLYGNFLADPVFVAPRDPRPNGDTNAVFFRYASYDLSSRSPAINLANQTFAQPTDILYRTPVAFAGRSVNGSGPASVGAFYYMGSGGITPTNGTKFTTTTSTLTPTTTAGVANPTAAFTQMTGGSLPLGTLNFAVVNTSLNPDGASAGKQGVATAISAPTAIEVNFSDNIDTKSVTASDLVLSGSGISATNPAKATSLTWVDSHTVKFLLTGGFNSAGTVNVSIPAGAVQDTAGDTLSAYAESFVIESQSTAVGSIGTTPAVTSTPTSAPTVSPTSVAASAAPVQPVVGSAATVALPIQPVALAGPIAVHYTKGVAASKSHSAKANAAATAKAEKKAQAAKAAAQAQAAKHAAAARHAAAKHAVAQVNAKHGKTTK